MIPGFAPGLMPNSAAKARHYYALTANAGSSNVTPLDLSNPLVPVASAPVAVGTTPRSIAISPNGLFALVANAGSTNVTPLDLSNPRAPVASAPVAVGAYPISVAISGL